MCVCIIYIWLYDIMPSCSDNPTWADFRSLYPKTPLNRRGKHVMAYLKNGDILRMLENLFQANSANSWTFFGCAGPVLTLRLNHGRFWGGSVDPPRSPGWIPAVLPHCVLVQSLGSSAKYWDWMILDVTFPRLFGVTKNMIPIIP